MRDPRNAASTGVTAQSTGNRKPDAGETKVLVSVIVPTYNEARNLAELVSRICAVVDQAEVLVVDDESPDGTSELAVELAQRFPLTVIRRTGERGLASAVVRGIHESRADICVVLDADLSHAPEDIPKLLAPVLQGADIGVGSRYIAGGEIDSWPFMRRFWSRCGTILARPLAPVRDPMSGFFCVRKGILANAKLEPRGYKILLEILARCPGARVVEIPIRFLDRNSGASKFGHKERWQFLVQLATLYVPKWPWLLLILLALAYGADAGIYSLSELLGDAHR